MICILTNNWHLSSSQTWFQIGNGYNNLVGVVVAIFAYWHTKQF